MALTAEMERRWAPAPPFYLLDDYLLAGEGGH